MSWIRTKTDETQSEAPEIGNEMNYNRDMNSPPLPARESPPAAAPTAAPTAGSATGPATGSAALGQSIRIEGTLTGSEDLTINGTVTGTVQLKGHSLTIGANGKVEAALNAKSVTVEGQVNGNISADDRIQITASGSVAGDLRAPRIALDDGAQFKGRVEMEQSKAPAADKS